MAKAPQFSDLQGNDESGKDEAFARLQEEVVRLKDARLEERFIWIVICTVLVDVLWFRSVSNPALPIVVMILELIILMILAKRMQIEDVQALMERIVYGMGKQGGGQG